MRDKDLIQGIEKCLKQLSEKIVAIITHSGGDPDSIGAAYVLSNILKKIFQVNGIIFKIPAEASTHSLSLLNRLDFHESEDGLDAAEAFIILDCGSPEQLNDLKWILELDKPIIVIDHHSTSREKFAGKAEVYALDEYQSVCEIVLDLASLLGYELSLREAEALFAGIYYDTVRLSIADSETFGKVCRLASQGIHPREVLQDLEVRMDVSERIARLKAAARMRIYRAGDWLIAVSRLSSFQSSAARSLVNLGAHVAIVAGESDEGITVSFRAIKEFIEATGINLGRDIAARIGAEFGGHGGGHSSAAKALCVKGDLQMVLARCIDLLSELLGESLVELTP